jgi:hypothetical protein
VGTVKGDILLGSTPSDARYASCNACHPEKTKEIMLEVNLNRKSPSLPLVTTKIITLTRERIHASVLCCRGRNFYRSTSPAHSQVVIRLSFSKLACKV